MLNLFQHLILFQDKKYSSKHPYDVEWCLYDVAYYLYKMAKMAYYAGQLPLHFALTQQGKMEKPFSITTFARIYFRKFIVHVLFV